MKKLLKQLGAALPSLLLTLGAAALAVGAGMIFVPAGVLTGGVLSLAAGWLLVRGGEAP